MTWGSNASYDIVKCPYCHANMVDDAGEWPTSHMKACPDATVWKRFLRWIGVL